MKKNEPDLCKTFIKSMDIMDFRSFKNVHINIGNHLTMISGINGVGKSTILGILAQICSFKDNYFIDNNNNRAQEDVSIYKTVYNQPFESEFRDHFKISNKYDNLKNSDYIVDFIINDSQERLLLNAELKGTLRGKSLRLVLRKEKSIFKNTSRNITFPTIFLSLKRLMPYVNRKETQNEKIFNDEESQLFGEINRSIFTPIHKNSKLSSKLSSDVNSSVLTSDFYDIESASSGEDNLGQIISSMVSFIRLKKSWNNYSGGLLLIDELDAGLFPKAQIELINQLNKFSAKNNVQVVFTTHSPTIISKMIELNEQSKKDFKTNRNIGLNFISDTHGTPENLSNLSFDQMIAALEVRSLTKNKRAKIRCYCEDTEAYTFLNMILTEKQKRVISKMMNVHLGGDSLISLNKAKVPEFSRLSLTILDGDKKSKVKSLDNIICLPSPTPPDQLMFKILFDTAPDDDYWKIDPNNWNKVIFLNSHETKDILANVQYNEEKQIYEIKSSNTNIKTRDLFKYWFNENYQILKTPKLNPIKKIWSKKNEKNIHEFRDQFDNTYRRVYSQYHYLS